MYQTLKQILLPITLLLLLLAGCTVRPQANSIESDIKFLTSDVCDGRLVGTAGNQAASDFISSQFQALGLSYLTGDQFLLPYTQMVFDSDASSQTVTAEFADGHSEAFLAGQDFYPFMFVGSLNLQGPVTTDPQSADLAQKILVSEERSERPCLAQVLLSESATATLLYTASYGPPAIRVNQPVFDRLKEATSIQFHSDVITKEITAPNVVGVLPGTEHKDALILSAHFDHVGSFGDTVYRGAYDNATGVAVLLEVARQMAAQTERPSFDVIFCALNGEDMGQQGSKVFANMELPYQTINVINLDALGLSSSGGRLAAAGDAVELCEQVQANMTASGIECGLGQFGKSDHLSFQAAGIPATTLCSWEDEPYAWIHTPKDTIDGVDLPFLDKLAVAVRDYIQTAQLVVPSQAARSDQQLLWEKADRMAAEAIQTYAPARDQVVTFTLQGNRFYARDCSPVERIEDALAIWPALELPNRLGSYSFRRLHFAEANDMNLRLQPFVEDAAETDVIPIAQEDKLYRYCLDYSDGQNQDITVTVYDNRFYNYDDVTALSEVEENVVDGHTLLYLYVSSQSGRVLNEIAYYDETLPCSFTVTSADFHNPVEDSALGAFVQDHIEVLKSLRPIEA